MFKRQWSICRITTENFKSLQSKLETNYINYFVCALISLNSFQYFKDFYRLPQEEKSSKKEEILNYMCNHTFLFQSVGLCWIDTIVPLKLNLFILPSHEVPDLSIFVSF